MARSNPQPIPFLAKVQEPVDLQRPVLVPHAFECREWNQLPWAVIDRHTMEVHHISYLGEGIMGALRDLQPDPSLSPHVAHDPRFFVGEEDLRGILSLVPEAMPWALSWVLPSSRMHFYRKMRNKEGIWRWFNAPEDLLDRIHQQFVSQIQDATEALDWAQKFPEDKDLVRHLIKRPLDAYQWCVHFPADVAMMAPLVKDSHLAYKWGYQVSRSLRHLVRDFVTKPDDIAAWVDRHPQDRDIMWPRIQTDAGALAWVRKFPGDYMEVVPYITRATTANVWATAYARSGEERDLVRHLVTESNPACDWGIAYPNDKMQMLPSIRGVKDAARWLEHYPWDWDVLVQQTVRSGQSALEWVNLLWEGVDERDDFCRFRDMQETPEDVANWLDEYPDDFCYFIGTNAEPRDVEFLEELHYHLNSRPLKRMLEKHLPSGHDLL